MAIFRVPLLVWENFNGTFAAQAVTGEDYFPPAAFAARRDAAIAEVKEYLQWLFENESWREPDEFDELKMSEFRVEVRPEYQAKEAEENEQKRPPRKKKREPKKRVYTSEELVPLRVACVSWKTESGNYSAALPLLDIEFFYERESELKTLVTLKVQEALRGSTPLALAKYLPPKQIELETLAFQARRKNKQAELVKETPNLAAVAEPLGAKDFTRKTSKAYERETETEDLVRRLTGEKASVIILGDAGTGKTAVLAEAVRQIEKDLLKNPGEEDFDPDTDEKNPRHRFWQTNGGRLISGMKYLGQWEERLENVIGELSDIEGVLCVENLLDLVRCGGRAPEESLAAFLAPYVERGEVRLVAEASPAELDACRRLLPGFANLFQIVRLPEFSDDKALTVLTRIADTGSRNLKIEYSASVVNLAFRLFKRFLPYQKFPGRATRFLTEVFEKAAKARQKEVFAENVIENFIRLTGLPELFLRDEITLDFADVVAGFEAEVIGQNAACRQAASVVTTFKAGLNDPRRPLGVFLFAGPTGVGKTELAKALARFFFGEAGRAEEKIVRLDMSEYSLAGAASRLLLKADGEPSELIQKVREKPFSVVLFDEIEKADAQVFDVLLGLFDEGRLTDRFGRVTNFTSTVVIMTSNLGAERFAKGDIGFGDGGTEISSEKEIKTFFRPEFFNRLDSVVQFKPLDKNSLFEITEKELAAIARREGLAERGIRLAWTKEVTEFLAKKGFDPRFGARPLQRTVETFLTAPLAEFLLRNPALRNCEIKIDLAEKDALKFDPF